MYFKLITTHHVVTSEVEAVIVTPVDEYALDARCSFIPGSDTIGCHIVLDSDHSNVERENATLKRKPHALYASGRLNLTHKTHCYDRVLAFNIDSNNSTSNFSIEGELPQKSNLTCLGTVTVIVKYIKF